MITGRRLVITVLVLACLAGLVYAGLRADTGADEEDVAVSGGEVVERLLPGRDDEVLRQSAVGIDLGPGWTGALLVNGVEIPEEQLQRNEALNEVRYVPGDATVFDALPAGRNCVAAVVWRSSQSREQSRTIDWCFQVT